MKKVSHSKYRDELLNTHTNYWKNLPLFEKFLSIILGWKKDILQQELEDKRMLSRNAYGLVISKDGYPVICGHGGSGWLCNSCADQITKDEK